MTRTCRVLGLALSSRAVSMPSSTGMLTPMTTTSGFAKCASMSASRPFAAVIAANPDDSRTRADRSRFSGDSSAIMTRAPDDAGRACSSGGVPTRRASIASSCCR